MKGIQIKWAILLLAVGSLMSSCLDTEDPVEERFKKDDKIISQYLAENNIQASKTQNGVYVETVEEGTGAQVMVDRVVDVGYEFRRWDDVLVGTDSTYIFQPAVGSFLRGLSEGVTLMREGEVANIYIPSLLAYGSNAFVLNGIPLEKHALIKLRVKLNDVRTPEQQEDYENAVLVAYADSLGYDSQSLESGLHHITVEPGDQSSGNPDEFSFVDVAYKGFFLDGNEFDGSDGEPVNFQLNRLIPGFSEGIQRMYKGEKALFLIPSHLAYGPSGNSNNIGPYTPILFEVTLVNFD